jgi:transposase-like protein
MLVACHRRVIAGRQGMPAARQQVAVKVAVPPQASTVVEASLLAVEDREAAPQGQGQGARQRCWWGVIHAPGFGAALGDHRPDLAKVQSGGEMGAVSVQHDLPVGGAFTPLLAEVARPCRHALGDRWYADETCVKVAGQWRYVYRAIDRFGQVIDGFVSPRRDAKAAHRFFQRAIGATKVTPVEVTTDRAPVYPAVLEERLPAAWHRTDRYANNRVEADHGRLKAPLRPMRGLKQDRSARVVIAGHALVQNVRRGHYELAAEEPATRRVAVAFDELATAM